jgi:hypothetical protein
VPTRYAPRQDAQQWLAGRSIASLVRFNFIALDPEETVARAKLRIQRSTAQPVYPVVSDGALLGVLTRPMWSRSLRSICGRSEFIGLVRRSRRFRPSISIPTRCRRSRRSTRWDSMDCPCATATAMSSRSSSGARSKKED